MRTYQVELEVTIYDENTHTNKKGSLAYLKARLERIGHPAYSKVQIKKVKEKALPIEKVVTRIKQKVKK